MLSGKGGSAMTEQQSADTVNGSRKSRLSHLRKGKAMIEQQDSAATDQQRERLRAAGPSDFDAIAALLAELHHYNASLDEHFTLATSWREMLREQFQRTLHLPSSFWLLAWVDDVPVGLLILEDHRDTPLFRYHRWVELVALYVRYPHRGAGLARRMMHKACEWAALRGSDCMQLYVTASNAGARSFYRACGWKPVQEIWRLELASPDHLAQVSGLD